MLSHRTRPRSLARAAAVAATLAAGLAAHAGPALAEDLVVKYDQSQLMRLPRPASEIIVGNPAIADVTVQGGALLVVTGKTFGITNLIALDSERNIIREARIVVQRDDRKIVNLMRGGVRQTYSCTPECQTTLTVGDDSAHFESVAKASERKVKFSGAAGDQGSGSE
jgi:hypothetical protein